MKRASPARPTRTALLALAAAAISRPAAAAPPCTALPSPVFVTGSSAVKPLLAELAKVLAASSPPLSIVYQGQGSCAGAAAFFAGTPLTGSGLSTWDASAEQKCDLGADGAPIDIAVSDVFATTCDPSFKLSDVVSDFTGPIQSMTFVVPNASKEMSLSAEAAYFIFGFGRDSGVDPWTDPTTLFQRGPGSGTQQMIAKAIGVPAGSFRGLVVATSDDMKNKVAFSTAPDTTIGILAADVANDSTSVLKVLAYQAEGQRCGYYPDSDATRNDKRNVRDGHYAIWGPLHFLTRVNINTGNPVNAGAQAMIAYLTGARQAPAGLDLIKLEAQHHVVPECAMRVRRTEEMGALASFMPTRSCWCYYDEVSGRGADCARCSGDADCPSDAPSCHFGYCEPQ